MAKRVFKDESRDAQKKAQKRADAIATVEVVLSRILREPSLCDDPDMVNIKSMICRIGRDRDKFPLPLDEGEDDLSVSSAGGNRLSSGVGKSLYGREDVDLSDAVIQITASSCETRTTRVDGNDFPHRMWKLNAVDGDATVITVRLDSTLNSEGKFLSPGAIVHVTSGFPVYMDYGDLYDQRCAIVVRSFRVLGRGPVPPGISKGPPQRLSVKEDLGGRAPGEGHDDVGSAEGGGASQNAKGVSREEGADACDCRGQLCSKHGVSFAVCVSKCVPVEKLSLTRVARECVFVDRELKNMEPNHLRFLCYWYYATSVYQFHGKGNRVVLPDCIINAIRKKYPDAE